MPGDLYRFVHIAALLHIVTVLLVQESATAVGIKVAIHKNTLIAQIVGHTVLVWCTRFVAGCFCTTNRSRKDQCQEHSN